MSRQHSSILTPKLVVIVAAASLAVGCIGGAGTVMTIRTINSTSSSSQMGEFGQGGQNAPGGQGGQGGANTMSFDYTGEYAATESADGESKELSGQQLDQSAADSNVVNAQNGGTLAISESTLSKSGGDASNDDNGNFYGVNAVATAVGEGSKITLADSSLTSNANGGNAIFATDSGTVWANNTTISTQQNNSRAMDATYSGTIIANEMTATTQGDHSATLATDRGGGTVSVTDSELSTAGSGSPLLYSTGNVQVNNVTGTATGSQIAGMEGLNTILINDSVLESTITSQTASDPVANGVIIYQSTSGDAEASTGEHATFQAKDSTLKSAIQSGSMFYFTNTTADVVLSNTTLDFDSSKANLILAAGNDANNWGSAGSNGATVNFTGIGQTLEGDVEADTISTVNLFLTEGSTWTGAATITENANGSTSEAPISVNVDATSTWVVSGDSTISTLSVADGGQVVDESGRTVTIVAGGQTVVQGDSDVTVTVTGSYGTTVTLSDDNALTTDLIVDRSEFDTEFGTSTTWSF